MANWEYKGVSYHRKQDGPNPAEIINQEAVNDWEFFTSLQIYRHEWILIFRRRQ